METPTQLFLLHYDARRVVATPQFSAYRVQRRGRRSRATSVAAECHERAPVPPSLVVQLAHELAPSHIADTLGERVVLDHVLDRKALDAHHLVFADEARGELVLVVPPSVCNSRVDAGHVLTSLCPVSAAHFLFGEPTLGFHQPLLVFGKIARIPDGLPPSRGRPCL